MPTYPNESAMICTAEDHDAACRMAVAMGHADAVGDSFTIPLSADGSEPATHYGTCAYVVEYWQDIIDGTRAGSPPEAPWELVGLTPELVTELLNRMIVATAPDGAPRALWEATLAENGLVEIANAV